MSSGELINWVLTGALGLGLLLSVIPTKRGAAPSV
jgi:hypothetical protein